MANEQSSSDVTAQLDAILEVITELRDAVVEQNRMLAVDTAERQWRELLARIELDPPIQYGPKAPRAS